MTHQKVFEIFKNRFPELYSESITYFPNGKNSIRLRGVKSFPYHKDLIFTYEDDDSWRLETSGRFIKDLKKSTK